MQHPTVRSYLCTCGQQRVGLSGLMLFKKKIWWSNFTLIFFLKPRVLKPLRELNYIFSLSSVSEKSEEEKYSRSNDLSQLLLDGVCSVTKCTGVTCVASSVTHHFTLSTPHFSTQGHGEVVKCTGCGHSSLSPHWTHSDDTRQLHDTLISALMGGVFTWLWHYLAIQICACAHSR